MSDGMPPFGGDAEFSLVTPFVNVTSRGGVFDDGAFCAGFEMGQLSMRLQAARYLGLDRVRCTIRRDNVEQADLLAMEAGAKLSIDDMADIEPCVQLEWSTVTIEWDP